MIQMITKQQADYLLNLPKHIIEDDTVLERKVYTLNIPISDRIYLVSKEDDEFSFFWELYQSPKNQIKLALHHQEADASIGLLRVDYNGRHKNPEELADSVPEIFRPFVGQWINESHIHHFVEGYKDLAWAIPLSIDSFPVKEYSNPKGLSNALTAFANSINLQTELTFQIQLF